MPPVRDPQVQRSSGFGQNHSLEVESAVGVGGALHSEPSRRNELEPPLDSSCCSLIFALCSSVSSPLRSPRFLSPLAAPPLPPPARGPARQATRQAQVIKFGLPQRTEDSRCARRGSGQGCAGDQEGPGPGEPPAVIHALPPAASPAPEPSTEPEPSPAQAPAAGQGAGSRSRSGSPPALRPPSGARPASKAGSGPRAKRASSFSAVQGNAKSAPSSSGAPWTRFIFQGPFGLQATGLGTGEAGDMWTTPAAYIGRRSGVSGPKRAAFIRDLEDGKRGRETP